MGGLLALPLSIRPALGRLEMIVDADANHVLLQFHSGRVAEGISELSVADIDEQIFELGAPIRAEHPFHAAADVHPDRVVSALIESPKVVWPRVNSVCVARTTKRQVRRQARRCAVWGAGHVCRRWQ
jgi:hypothetical protein